MHRRLRTLLLLGAAVLAAPAVAQVTVNGSPATISQVIKFVWNGQDISSTNPVPVNVVAGGTGGGSSPAGVTRTRLSCTLPAYASGGNAVCTDQSGQQTTTTCAANTACQILPANANRKTFFIQNRTSGVTVDYGYSATIAPGTGIGADGTSATNGQGAGFGETPAHIGAYFATASAAATITVVQGQ